MRWHDTCTRVSTVSVVSVSCLSCYREGHEIKRQKGTGGRRMGYGVQEVGGCDHPLKMRRSTLAPAMSCRPGHTEGTANIV